MANHKSAKKRIRRNAKQSCYQRCPYEPYPYLRQKGGDSNQSGNATEAREALRTAQPELQRGVTRGVIHRNTASRKISRLSARVKALAA